eukprot:TRINITY_DN10647_c0_g2_i1.p1 TRINITY_DN10647_c0_g2~~TRINITY_DN10647_c0_g2_i1.p1  ORF type:complete len:515 (+),score=66.40 TRINITY_DN10647_c0_g2_i1:88-1632(+)
MQVIRGDPGVEYMCIHGTVIGEESGDSEVSVVAPCEVEWGKFESAMQAVAGCEASVIRSVERDSAVVVDNEDSFEGFVSMLKKSTAATTMDKERFPYLGWKPEGAVPMLFDTRDEACTPYGYSHGDVVKHTEGSYKDETSKIIGVREGELWYDTGSIEGALFTPGLKCKKDFENRLGWVVEATMVLKPFWSVTGRVVVTKQQEERKPTPSLSNDWTKGKLLGCGAYGTVFAAMDNETGVQMAVKVVSLKDSTYHDDDRRGSAVRSLEREIEVLSSLKHPNIVRYIRAVASSKKICIFMEFMAGGSLADLCRRTRNGLSIKVLQRFIRQLLQGMQYLHSHNIIHRDIKAANILTDAEGVVKLADFGASKKLNEIKGQVTSGLKGTVCYLSPEAIRDHEYGMPSDIWAVGCTMIECCTGRSPWSEAKFEHEYQALIHIASSATGPRIPGHLPSQAVSFLKRCLAVPASARPDTPSLLQDPFLTDDIENSTAASVTREGSDTSSEFDSILERTDSSF